MGMFTHITIRNDRLHEIRENPARFVEDTIMAISQDEYVDNGHSMVQRYLHQDTLTGYLQFNGLVLEIDRFNEHTKSFKNGNIIKPTIAALEELEERIEELKEYLKS